MYYYFLRKYRVYNKSKEEIRETLLQKFVYKFNNMQNYLRKVIFVGYYIVLDLQNLWLLFIFLGDSLFLSCLTSASNNCHRPVIDGHRCEQATTSDSNSIRRFVTFHCTSVALSCTRILITELRSSWSRHVSGCVAMVAFLINGDVRLL